jgi:hypothetical protein
MLGHSKLGAETQRRLGRVHHREVVRREASCWPMTVGNRHPCQATH